MPVIHKRVNLIIKEVEISVVCPVDGEIFRVDDEQVDGLKPMICPNGDWEETHDVSDDYPDKETVLLPSDLSAEKFQNKDEVTMGSYLKVTRRRN